MTSALAVVENDELIREAMKAVPERVDILVTGIRTDIQPIERVIREKDDMGMVVTRVEPVIDEETGQPKTKEVEVVEYEVVRDGIKNGGEIPLRDILSVDLRKPSDDYSANIAKARAASVMQQLERIRNNHDSVLPDGHLPLEKWGGASTHVIAVLKHNRIYSVQQLRDLTEAQVSRLPGGIQAQRLRDEARAFLLRKQDKMQEDALQGMRDELRQSRNENAELRDMVNKLLQRFDPSTGGNDEVVSAKAQSDQSDFQDETPEGQAASTVEAKRSEADSQRHAKRR